MKVLFLIDIDIDRERERERERMKRVIVGCVRRHPFVVDSGLAVNVATARQFSTRVASDQMMGYSPMAPASPSFGDSSKKGIPTADDVTTMGGVWAPTSAKRDKLAELRIELEEGQDTLDDAATDGQKLDLYLADGIETITKFVDTDKMHEERLTQFVDWMETSKKNLPAQIALVQWEAHLASVSAKVDNILAGLPKTKHLTLIRDFVPLPDEEGVQDFLTDVGVDDVALAHAESVYRYRLLLLKAAAQHLKNAWDKLTTVSSEDVDRAAVQGQTLEPKASTLSLQALNDVLVAFTTGNCAHRVDAMWNLIDRDQDGLLDEVEMGIVCQLSVAPVGSSIQQLLDDSIQARPVRHPITDAVEEKEGEQQQQEPPKLGFLARRRQTAIERRLKKLMKAAATNHFEVEAEMPHRLRCIYAWAEKEHQDNKIDSVHVDTGLGGRKRYVELQPKISLPEFRQVQKEHFTHLDRVGQEIVKSFREDLLVDQGKGRQRAELQKNTLIFLGVVSVIDFGIYFL